MRSERLSDLPKVTQLVRTELWASRVLSPSPFSPDCYQDPLRPGSEGGGARGDQGEKVFLEGD